MKLEIEQWKEFVVSDLFEKPKIVKYASTPETEGMIPFISSTAKNNGVSQFCGETPHIISSCITVSTNGNCFDCFYHNEPICISTDVEVLVNNRLSCFQMLFVCTILKQESQKYNYGRKAKNDKVWQTIIKLPSKSVPDETGKSIYEPDWQFMEDYIKSLRYKLPETQIQKNQSMTLDVTSWKEFKVSELFSNFYKAQAHTKEDVTENTHGIHFVSRTYENNGIDIYVQADDIDNLEEDNCLIIGDTTASCFYQDQPFIAGDHIVVLRASWLNKYRGLFIKTLFDKERFRYCYGRAFRMDLIKKTILKLPAKKDNNMYVPDWQFMEDYIKSLPYSDLI